MAWHALGFGEDVAWLLRAVRAWRVLRRRLWQGDVPLLAVVQACEDGGGSVVPPPAAPVWAKGTNKGASAAWPLAIAALMLVFVMVICGTLLR